MAFSKRIPAAPGSALVTMFERKRVTEEFERLNGDMQIPDPMVEVVRPPRVIDLSATLAPSAAIAKIMGVTMREGEPNSPAPL